MKKSWVVGIFCYCTAVLILFIVTSVYSYRVFKSGLPAVGDQQEEAASVVAVEDKTGADTKYVLEKYDMDSRTLDRESLPLPASYVGITRQELEEILQQQNRSPGLGELEKGFVNAYIASFTPEEVTVRANYRTTKSGSGYYIMEENGYLIVYYPDRTTVYDHTHIQVNVLPQTLKEQLAEGIYLGSQEELFDFLETYSS